MARIASNGMEWAGDEIERNRVELTGVSSNYRGKQGMEIQGTGQSGRAFRRD